MSFKIGRNCKIHPTAVINVKEGSLGEGSIVNENARIEGQKIIIGREAFIDRGASIGGGSCFDPQAELRAGDWLHMGTNSHINIARGVFIGHEFGCGIETKIFTHGAYTDSYNLGAPVQWGPVHIGDHVWCPNAWINPGVKIGHHVVVSARSLVNSNLPDGCLAGGIPSKIIRENYLPRSCDKTQIIEDIIRQTRLRIEQSHDEIQNFDFLFHQNDDTLRVKWSNKETLFELKSKKISGHEELISTILKDQLRRNGIRFRYEWHDDKWSPWLTQD